MARQKGKNFNETEWEKTHGDGYQATVYSVTHDRPLCDNIVNHVTALRRSPAAIWVPGCGSVGNFEKAFAETRHTCDTILCTDFAGVIKQAPPQANAKITYQACDSADAPFRENFDVVIPINSVLSGSHKENEAMLKNFQQALKPGGVLVGLFPTVICAQDIALTTKKRKLKQAMTEAVDMKNSAVIDAAANSRQIFYTPGNLHKKMTAAGFKDIAMEIAFFETPYFKKESKRMYGLTEKDIPIYELLVTAHKPY